MKNSLTTKPPAAGIIYRKGEARRSWTWKTDDASGETYYRNRKDAIAALLEQSAGKE